MRSVTTRGWKVSSEMGAIQLISKDKIRAVNALLSEGGAGPVSPLRKPETSEDPWPDVLK